MSASATDSSPDASGSTSTSAPSQKKRRIPNACDNCKRRKIRCNSRQMPGNRCTNCIDGGLACTHFEVTRSLGPAKGYVENLEQRLEKMEKLLTRLIPNVDITKEIEEDEDEARYEEQNEHIPRNDDQDAIDLSIKLQTLDLAPAEKRFYGKSSGAYLNNLIQTELSRGQDSPLFPKKKHHMEFYKLPPYHDHWAQPKLPVYDFPDHDLIISLADLYFEYVNVFLPLLHRPTLVNGINSGLYLRDHMCGGVVLLVCALGARFSDDPRVLLRDGDTLSAGWKYFQQVQVIRSSLAMRPSLYELQMYPLAIMYEQSVRLAQGAWTEVGLALRMAIDVGAHRRQTPDRRTEDDELWKRAFWVLLALDRMLEAHGGRPCTVHDEDYDVEFPLECDDEYWELSDSDQNFKQPRGKMSTVTAFNAFLKLLEISAYATRTIYSIKRTTTFPSALSQQSDQQTIAELDSALNEWMNNIPDHLRWDPGRQGNDIFFQQAAFLYASYYQLQVYVHRPFIPAPGSDGPLSSTSLSICTRASRSCIRLAEIHRQRTKGIYAPLPHMTQSFFTCAVILLLNSWTGIRSGQSHAWKELALAKVCVQLLADAKSRWKSCSHLWWFLNKFVSAGEQFVTSDPGLVSFPNNLKRRREVDDHTSLSDHDSSVFPESIVGIHSIDHGITQQAHSSLLERPLDHSPINVLPEYENETDTFSIYRQFNLHDPFATLPDAIDASTSIPTASDLYDTYSMSAAGHAEAASEIETYPLGLVNGLQGNNATTVFSGQRTGCSASGAAATSTRHFTEPLAMDINTMEMWSKAPSGFDVDEWDTYLNGFTQMADDH